MSGWTNTETSTSEITNYRLFKCINETELYRAAFVFCSVQSELLPYAEVVNGLLVQVLNSSLSVGDKEQGRQQPMRFLLWCRLLLQQLQIFI